MNVLDIIKATDETAYKRMILNIKQKYLSMNGKLKGDGFYEDEIVADAAKKINGSYSQMLKVLDEHPTFGKQLGDKMIELYQNILGANKTSRDNIFDNAEAQSIEKAAKLRTQAMQEKGIETADSVDNAEGRMYSINEDFVSEYDSWVAAGKPDRKTLVVGTTSKALQSIGVKLMTL